MNYLSCIGLGREIYGPIVVVVMSIILACFGLRAARKLARAGLLINRAGSLIKNSNELSSIRATNERVERASELRVFRPSLLMTWLPYKIFMPQIGKSPYLFVMDLPSGLSHVLCFIEVSMGDPYPFSSFLLFRHVTHKHFL